MNSKGLENGTYSFIDFSHAPFGSVSFILHNVYWKTLYVSSQVNVTVWSSSVSDGKNVGVVALFLFHFSRLKSGLSNICKAAVFFNYS